MSSVQKLRRPKALASALILVIASVVPVSIQDGAQAYGLLTRGKITMSNSASGATDTTYEVNFNTVTDLVDIQGVVIDFCSNSPIIGEVCTAPVGFDTNESKLAMSSTGVTGFSSNAATTANKIVLTRASSTGISANTNVVITFGTAAANDGITNPGATNTTFYARIIVFNTSAGATSYNSATQKANNPGSEQPIVDYGGVALSTAEQINVTAKVQEKLTFCIYTDPGSSDTAKLSPDAPYNNADCNTTTQTAGLTGGTGGTGSAQSAYDINTTDGTMSTYGDLFATKNAGDFSTGIITMLGNLANTTEAGIYTTTLTFIATGTY